MTEAAFDNGKTRKQQDEPFMKVKDVMTANVRTCFMSDNMVTAAGLMWDHDCGCIPVLNEEGLVVGMLTDRDICMAVFFQGVPMSETAGRHAKRDGY